MKLIINKSKTEEQLINGCLSKDPEAQRDLYERYSAIMFTVCSRYVKDVSEAEDVLLTGFLKIFNRIGQFKGDGSFEGWIRRIMVNESLTYIRRNKSMYLEVDIDKADREPDYQKLDNNLEAEDLMRMIARLPDGYRTVFNLYAIEGYSHKEIADNLGISENTSKSQLSRARKLLQKYLVESEEYYDEKSARDEQA